jgi:hypothetical protein
MGLLGILLEKLRKWCDCEKNPLDCHNIPVDSAIPPDDPCGTFDKEHARWKALELKLEQEIKNRDNAKVVLANCQECK